MPMRQRKDHGTSIVEFALVLSLFFLLIFGIPAGLIRAIQGY